MSALPHPLTPSLGDTSPSDNIGPSDEVRVAAALVRRLASDPSLWRGRVRFGQRNERWYERLDVDADHEVWLISWLPGQSTGLHDHGEALGAFTVVQGALTETAAAPIRPGRRLRPVSGRPWQADGGFVRTVRRRFLTGRVRSFGYEHVHDVGNHGSVPAVSLHAYAPELTAMTKYVLDDRRLRIVSSERVGLDW
jgi:predicted metal-dependent enzyme (double-stranded beta helix superfamily)